MINLDSFWDELDQIAPMLKTALKIPTKIPAYVKYPAAGTGAVLGWEGLNKLKRQRDLGAAMEAQMEQQGG